MRARAIGLWAVACAIWAAPEVASACGGCFHQPIPPGQVATDITDERMLLAVSPQQTTLYDQIVYSGTPSSFAWVLPIKGTVTVGLSGDVLFDAVDALTATTIEPPASTCPRPPRCGGAAPTGGGGCGSLASSDEDPSASFDPEAVDAGAQGAGGVTVEKQQIVGPYETVQLSATSPTALSDWLAANGFDIPAAAQPILAAYQSEGFGFLAMRLEPGQGVQAMRPVRVTSTGASLSLPLRMASIGTGATVGITIWVVSDGRYEPQNFPVFQIQASQLVWDWSMSSSNYTTLRQQQEAQYAGRGWELESAFQIAQQSITSVIDSGGVYEQTLSGPAAAALPPVAADQDYVPVTDASGNVTETAEQVRSDDIAALFAGLSGPNAFVTRMRSDVAHSAMNVDFTVQASADQSQLSNVRTSGQSINETCTLYNSNCAVVGTGTPAQAAAASSQGGGSSASSGSSGSSGGGGACATSKSNREPPVSLAAVCGLLALLSILSRTKRR